ncbi:alpha-1,6-glucosidase domain-containing protein [Pseudocolwellia agarivorans]|uniref:alpha-1,6-glucosidase domain-containing protein n=1 Tax=Pseudocolwellia agarivorans TaxID=1911682 RepID=UPI0009848DEC|nr:alpha-1,6-glucosidase domain-containing protein [Pseudocolwellia agarivorans]
MKILKKLNANNILFKNSVQNSKQPNSVILTNNTFARLIVIALCSLVLNACGGSDTTQPGQVLLSCNVPMVPDATGESCVDPEPIQCAAPTVPDALNESCIVGANPDAAIPVFFPAENQAVLYYNRVDENYAEYKVHNWNDTACDAYADDSLAASWDNGLPHTGIDPVYGAYWVFNLKEGFNECGNFIVHKGTDDAGKEFGGGNFKMPLKQDNETYQRMNFTISGEASIFEFPIESLGEQALKISNIAGHWIDANTLVWNVENIINAKLHHSATGGISADPQNNGQVNGSVLELTPVDLTDEQKSNAPLVAEWPAYRVNLTTDEAKIIAKNQLALVGYDNESTPIAATYIQADLVLDDLYTRGDNDADEAKLGVVYENGMVSVSVWSPTAQDVNLKVYDSAKNLTATHDMTEDPATGIWTYHGDASLDRQFYRFELSIYHHKNKAIELIESTDPYSVSLSTNGEYSQFVNLNDEDLQPEGWEGHTIATIKNYEDAVIYEGHIRDFSINDQSTSAENRGKYLAFTELDSVPMQHLKTLADNGLTHFQMLPANDIATINEDPAKIINLDSTVLTLCKKVPTAEPCYKGIDNQTLRSVLESYDSSTNDAAKLMDIIQDYDSFNWGYDPKHFNVPDGIYASNADGVTRIKEMRAMIKGLHDTGLRVVLDVVYNHTNSADLWDNSVLDKIVPGYYHSRDVTTGAVQNSTCCSDTALEHKMMNKLMVDSLKQWTTQYQFDGFRFDIMSQGSKAQMLAARDAIQAIDPDNHFYGEGWYKDSRGFERADQENMAGSEIGTYNDRLRDGIRDAALFNNETSEGALFQQDIIKFGMAGTLSDYILKTSGGADTQGSAFGKKMYAHDPADIINYISKHDNETLWDELQFNLDTNMSMDERVRAQNVSHSIVMLSQGIPFLQMGGDFLRSKSLDRNTYDAGDWYNLVDFTLTDNNWNKGLPIDKGERDDTALTYLSNTPEAQVYATEMMFASSVFNEFLAIRSASPLFRLTTADDIIKRVGFHNIGKNQTQGLIVMSIDDGGELVDLDANYDAIMVIVNGTNTEKTHTVATAVDFTLHPRLANSVDSTVASSSFTGGVNEGSFTVPAFTTAVFVKTQGETQGAGLSAYATAGAPDVVPFGDNIPLIRGDMNGWGETDSLVYKGDGIYQVAITLSANSYGFKIASSDWSTVNLGAPNTGGVVTEGETFELLPASNDNLSITIGVDGTYIFELDASNTQAPTLTITNEEPFVGTAIFVRGDMNGWSEDNAFTYIGGGKYQTTINISASTPNFKIASADWSTVNMGAPADDLEVLEGEVQLLLSGSNDNFNMTFTEDGDYTFVFDASNLAEPTLSVYAAKMFGNTTTFIRGDMNGWGEVDTLVYQSASNYSVEIDLTANTVYNFKVASADWSTINLGAQSNNLSLMVDSTYELVANSNDNINITVAETGTYLFNVTGPNPNTPTITVTKKL